MGTVRLLVAAAVAVALSVSTPAGATAVRQDDPERAPATTISPDGRSATDGRRTLSVSQTAGLDPAGQVVTVDGVGYDERKGVYVALCAVPPLNALPTPCGGGVDTEGTAGASHWISSDPPSYGVGLASPYGPGGSFSTRITVGPVLPGGIDCRVVRCAVLTRSDHTRTADRSQDLMVPVTFAAPAGPSAPTVDPQDPTAPPADGGGGASGQGGDTVPAAPSTTAAPLPTTTAPTPPPTTIPVDGGLGVSDGSRTLRVSQVSDLSDGATVAIAGERFDTSTGTFVALCAWNPQGSDPGDPVAAADALGPCSGGSEGSSAWVSSDPPDYGAEVAEPYGPEGSFEVSIDLTPSIDADVDCREVACAVVARTDDPVSGIPALAVAVTFAPAAVDEDADGPAAAGAAAEVDRGADGEGRATTGEEGAGDASSWVVAALVAVVVAAGAGVFAVFRRRIAPTASGGAAAPSSPTAGLGT